VGSAPLPRARCDVPIGVSAILDHAVAGAASVSLRRLKSSLPWPASIAEVLPCMVKDGGQLVTPCGDLVELLARERDRIDSALRELTSARRMLDAIIAASGSARLAT
jgi:hypothetical protein